MPSQALLWALPAVLCLAAPALAQQQPRPDPWDAKATVPPAAHRSTLSERPRAQDTAPQDWREANQRAHQNGGWRTHARESLQPAPAPAASASTAAAPAPGPAQPAQHPVVHGQGHGLGHTKP